MSKLIVTPTDIGYKLLSNYMFDSVIIPAGYETNGADIPRILWSIIPPFKPKYLPAIVVHDYLCSQQKYKYADDCFEKMLLSIERSLYTKSMVAAVRLYHRVRYQIPM